MTPPSVLFVNHTAKLGGGELALLALVRELRAVGFPVQVLLFEHGPLVERLAPYACVRVLPLSTDITSARKDRLATFDLTIFWTLLRTLYFVARVAVEIALSGVDIVHTNSLKADCIGGLAARLARKRLVFHVRDRIVDDYLPRSVVIVFRRLMRFLPHAVIVNSQATKETIGFTESTNTPLLRVIHDGLDIEQFTGMPPINSDQPVIGLIGRISPWKGQDVFIQAIGPVLKRFPNCQFRIVGSALFGEGIYEEQLHALVLVLKVQQAVKFMGFSIDVRSSIEELDILVHASTIPEPFGQVIIEGMALQRPVIASKAGGPLEIITDGENGLLVECNQPDLLATAICKLVGDPDLGRRLGSAGRSTVIERFTIQRVAGDVRSVYRDLISQ